MMAYVSELDMICLWSSQAGYKATLSGDDVPPPSPQSGDFSDPVFSSTQHSSCSVQCSALYTISPIFTSPVSLTCGPHLNPSTFCSTFYIDKAPGTGVLENVKRLGLAV